MCMHLCAGVLHYVSAFVSHPNRFMLCVCDSSGKQMGERDVCEHCVFSNRFMFCMRLVP